jgi:hypothetical protein
MACVSELRMKDHSDAAAEVLSAKSSVDPPKGVKRSLDADEPDPASTPTDSPLAIPGAVLSPAIGQRPEPRRKEHPFKRAKRLAKLDATPFSDPDLMEGDTLLIEV